MLPAFAELMVGRLLSGAKKPVNVDTVEEVTTGTSGLTYDPLTDRYQYNWKTPKSYAGSCYRLDVRFTDGSTFTASFVFNK